MPDPSLRCQYSPPSVEDPFDEIDETQFEWELGAPEQYDELGEAPLAQISLPDAIYRTPADGPDNTPPLPAEPAPVPIDLMSLLFPAGEPSTDLLGLSDEPLPVQALQERVPPSSPCINNGAVVPEFFQWPDSAEQPLSGTVLAQPSARLNESDVGPKDSVSAGYGNHRVLPVPCSTVTKPLTLSINNNNNVNSKSILPESCGSPMGWCCALVSLFLLLASWAGPIYSHLPAWNLLFRSGAEPQCSSVAANHTADGGNNEAVGANGGAALLQQLQYLGNFVVGFGVTMAVGMSILRSPKQAKQLRRGRAAGKAGKP